MKEKNITSKKNALWTIGSSLGALGLSLGIAVGCADVEFTRSQPPPPGAQDNPPGVDPCVENCGPNTGESPTPGESPVPSPTTPYYPTYQGSFRAPDKLDLVVCIDNSRSTETEHQRISARFERLFTPLNSLNVQIVFTTSDMNGSYQGAGGSLFPISGGGTMLSTKSSGWQNKFRQTVQSVGSQGHGDERCIYALKEAVGRNQGGWIRQGSDLAAIIISDEDERSVGRIDNYTRYPMVDGKDYPKDFLNVSAVSQRGRQFSAHAIIVKPGDNTCLEQQKKQPRADPSYGQWYANLVNNRDRGRTGGQIGSVCASDWGSQLRDIGKTLTRSTEAKLRCTPIDENGDGIPDVRIERPQNISHINIYVSRDKLIFDPALPGGTKIEYTYKCYN